MSRLMKEAAMVGDSVSEKGSVVDEEGKVVCGRPTGRI
jgi:hypothetical protein